jgi:hypothetical protein
MQYNLKKIVLTLVVCIMVLLVNHKSLADEYIQVAGLIDLRTDFSDGAHTLDYMTKLAEKRGFNVLFITDHDREVLEYGIWPFQNILKKRVEEPSINKGGPENYLNMIRTVSQRHPEMILIPGAESSPFYYWKGSYFTKNLTVCDWERHLLILGLEKPEDYRELPILHNGYSTRFLSSIPIGFFISFIPLIIGLYMWKKKKKIVRYLGIIIFILSLFLLLNNHPFRSSPYSPYKGYQGISPYQLLIDYVNSRGGMVFWNHPETKSGKGKLGPVYRETRPYPQVLTESNYYTGFAALYGDSTTVTEPGNIWDEVLNQYCSGRREKPAWGISTADFHKEGGAGEKLGNFPTIFLVKDKTKKDILDALRRGRMYACRGDVDSPRLVLEEFSISDPETSQKAVSGEEMSSKGYPRINILISTTKSEKGDRITARLIRSGKLLKTFTGETPLNIDYQDEYKKPGKKIYYRLDVKDKRMRKLVSNPIFVKFQD